MGKTNPATTVTEIEVRGTAIADVARGWFARWRPRPKLTLSRWSSLNARLDNGKRFRAFPFQDGIADAFTDPLTRQVTVKKSSRIGYSQIVQNYVGYCIDQAPKRLLIYQPTIDDAEKYSRDDLEPVLQWPAVRKVATFKPRHRDNQVRAKRFKGGWIQIKGANSPKEFRRVTADAVLLEEPDGYPPSAGLEGDPARLAFKRNLTSDEPLSAAGSTPTIAGLSRIDDLFHAGTQEHRYVPCPTCGTMQILVFGDGTGPGIRWAPRHNPTRASYQCITGCEIEETNKAWMDAHGEWRAHNPEAGPRHRSFHIWSAYSQHEGAAWIELAREFLEVHRDPNRLKTFVNQVLGDVWQETGEAPEWKRLYDRRETALPIGTVPDWPCILVGSVDVQREGDGRLELDIWAFGAGNRRALVDHIDVIGAASDKRTWARLDKEIARTWSTDDGRRLRLSRVAIDSGDGVNTMYVYAWARRHPGFVMAVKGRETIAGGMPIAGPSWMEVTVDGKKIKRGVKVWTVNTSMLKLELYGHLQLDRPVDGEGYPEGYVFLPDGTTDEWVKQLVSEQLVTKKLRNGKMRREWQQTRPRNEALDNAVYARAISLALGVDRWKPRKWAEVSGALRVARAPAAPAEQTDALPAQGLATAPSKPPPKPAAKRRKPNPYTTRR